MLCHFGGGFVATAVIFMTPATFGGFFVAAVVIFMTPATFGGFFVAAVEGGAWSFSCTLPL